MSEFAVPRWMSANPSPEDRGIAAGVGLSL